MSNTRRNADKRGEKTDTSKKKGNEAFQALFYEKASVDTNMNASE
jgi:hypothetical protein